ncbi:hypothetical protein OIU78_024298 [Salix suchowensis]|nr:hypothetical protein OIU78_024298 [Salix suchowensis]
METFENNAGYQNYWEMTGMFWNDELNRHLARTVIQACQTELLHQKLLKVELQKETGGKDAIDYIQDLQEEETRLQDEIMGLESERLEKERGYEFDERERPALLRSKKTKYDQISDHRAPISDPIEVHQLSVTSMGEKTLFVSLTCSKTADAMIRICEVFESLKLKIITANITTLSGMVKKTVLIEADLEEMDHLKLKIERAISVLSGPYNPQSM